MVNLRDRWSDCQLLAEQLKRRSLASPLGEGQTVMLVDAEQSTAEAIADLQRRAEVLRRRYGL